MNYSMAVLFIFALLNIQTDFANENTATLQVTVARIIPDEGVIKICLFDREEYFSDRAKVCKIKTAPSEKTTVSVSSQKLAFQAYAVLVYQDINLNDRLDKNFLGLPAEPYGFSNHPNTFFGTPSFQRASFEIQEEFVHINTGL